VQLHHDRVVRRLAGPWPLSDAHRTPLRVRFPTLEEPGKQAGVVAIVSGSESGATPWAIQLSLENCADEPTSG
jgi:hypothetical protein